MGLFFTANMMENIIFRRFLHMKLYTVGFTYGNISGLHVGKTDHYFYSISTHLTWNAACRKIRKLTDDDLKKIVEELCWDAEARNVSVKRVVEDLEDGHIPYICVDLSYACKSPAGEYGREIAGNIIIQEIKLRR